MFLALLILVTINYVDRAVISVLMPMIQEDLQFSPELVGVILSAFFWGYVVMQIPSGWLCDKFAPGKVIVGTGILWGINEKTFFEVTYRSAKKGLFIKHVEL